MYVKPAEGLMVPDPDLRDVLPAEGRNVVPSQYWTRRLLDGDVLETAGPSDPALPAPPRTGKVAVAAAHTPAEESRQ